MQKFIQGRDIGDAKTTLSFLNSESYYEKDITVFISCLNEEDSIYESLCAVVEGAKDINFSYEIHVFNDGSNDGTLDQIKNFAANHPDTDMLVVNNSKPHGIAENCFDSAFLARGRWHRMGWADCVDDADNWRRIFSGLEESEILIINYYIVHGKSKSRKVISKLYRNIVNLISGYKIQYHNGGNCYPTILLKRYHVESRGFGFQADLLTRILDGGSEFKEIKLESHERVAGSSSALKLKNWLSVTWMLFRMIIRRLKKEFF